MRLQAERDIFGRVEQFTSEKFRHILDLLDGYMKGEPYTIREIWQDDVLDKNGRVDIEIFRTNGDNMHYCQKLLILKDEVIDGETFHKRYHEWY